MDNLKKSNKMRSIIKSKLSLLVLVIFAVLLINASWKMYKKSVDAKKYMYAVEEEFYSLEKQYKDVNEDLQYIKSGTGFEKEVRSKFDLGKEGEKAIMIIEDDPVQIKEPEKRGFWNSIKRWASF